MKLFSLKSPPHRSARNQPIFRTDSSYQQCLLLFFLLLLLLFLLLFLIHLLLLFFSLSFSFSLSCSSSFSISCSSSFSICSSVSFSCFFSSNFSYSFSPTSATPAGAFINAAGTTDDLLRLPPPTSATDELRLSLPRPAWRMNAVQCSAGRSHSLHKRHRPVGILQMDQFSKVDLCTECKGFETYILIYFCFSFKGGFIIWLRFSERIWRMRQTIPFYPRCPR